MSTDQFMPDDETIAAIEVQDKALRRRVRIYTLGRRTLKRLLSGRIEIREPPLPDDATIANVSYDPFSDSLVVIVRSASFDEVPEGQVIPQYGAMRIYDHGESLIGKGRALEGAKA
jgi:hypothetical protein